MHTFEDGNDSGFPEMSPYRTGYIRRLNYSYPITLFIERAMSTLES